MHDRGRFWSFKAIHAVSFPLCPKSYHMGPYKSNPGVFFLLAEFREAGQQLPEPERLTTRLAELQQYRVSVMMVVRECGLPRRRSGTMMCCWRDGQRLRGRCWNALLEEWLHLDKCSQLGRESYLQRWMYNFLTVLWQILRSLQHVLIENVSPGGPWPIVTIEIWVGLWGLVSLRKS